MKRFFLKGLLVVLPMVLTIAVLYLVLGFLYNNVGVPIGDALKWSVRELAGDYAAAHQESWFFKQGAPLIGFAAAIVLTLVAGFIMATFFGKKLYEWFEALMKRIPVIGVVYPYARQFTDFFLGDKRKAEFKSAVAIPYPSPGIYSLGFVTGEGLRTLNEVTHKHLVCVFIPASPTPISGFLVYVPRENIIPLPISADEAMRILITAGVIHPAHQSVLPGAIEGGAAHPPVPEELVRALTRGQDPSKR